MRQGLGERGFTLVELSVTVAIIGILAAIAIPSFTNVVPRVRLSNATATLANELAMARMAAIAKSTDAEVRFNPAGDSYLLARAVGGTSYATTNVGSFADLQGLTYLFDGTAASNTLLLHANGTTSVPLQKQAVIITLASRDGVVRKRVLVWATGRIHTQKWAGGSSWVED